MSRSRQWEIAAYARAWRRRLNPRGRARELTLHLSLRTCGIIPTTTTRRCIRIRPHPRLRLGRFGSPPYPILLLQDRVEVSACSATAQGERGGHRFARVDLGRVERVSTEGTVNHEAPFAEKEGREGRGPYEIDDGARSDCFQVFDERARVAAISRRSVDTFRRVIIEFLRRVPSACQ